MQPRERLLVGALLLGVGLGVLPMMVAMPQWQAIDRDTKTTEQKNTELSTTQNSVSRLKQEISRLHKLDLVPDGVTVRKIENGDSQQAVKAMLDDIITLARHYDNELVVLAPFAVSAPKPAASAAPATKVKLNRRGRRQMQAAAPEPAAAPPPRPSHQSFGYKFTIRGTYSAIEEFIAVLSTHPELIEVQGIQFENEGGHTRDNLIAGTNVNGKPMKATLSLVLYLT